MEIQTELLMAKLKYTRLNIWIELLLNVIKDIVSKIRKQSIVGAMENGVKSRNVLVRILFIFYDCNNGSNDQSMVNYFTLYSVILCYVILCNILFCSELSYTNLGEVRDSAGLAGLARQV